MSDTVQNRLASQSEAFTAAREAMAEIANSHSLTTQEQLDLLAGLAAHFSFEQADRVTGWETRCFGILHATYAAAIGRLHDLIDRVE